MNTGKGMSENLKLDMTVDEALAFAEEWTRGMTLHAGLQGWRVVCLLLGEEVKALREENERMERIHDCFATEDADLLRRIGAQLEDIDYLGDYADGVAVLKQHIADLESQLAELRQGGEAVYMFRRKGLDDFCTCSIERYEELKQKPNLFEVLVTYTRPQPAIPPGYVVPDEMETVGFFESSEQEISEKSYCSGWNDCRKALLSAAPSVPVAEKPTILIAADDLHWFEPVFRAWTCGDMEGCLSSLEIAVNHFMPIGAKHA